LLELLELLDCYSHSSVLCFYQLAEGTLTFKALQQAFTECL
jgi:hypothetical protein